MSSASVAQDIADREPVAADRDLGRRIASGTMWLAIETWGQQAMLFAVFIVLARLLDPDAIGLAALAMVAPIILGVPLTKGLPDAIIQRPHITPEHLDSVFWLLAGGGICFSGLVWLAAPLLADWFGQPLIAELVRGTSLIIACQSLAAVPIAVLKRELNFRILAMRTLVGTVVGGSVGVAAAFSGYGVWSLVLMQLVKAAAETSVLLLAGSWRPRLHFSYARCRELFGFASPIVGFSLWNFINDEMPKVVLGTFLGPHAVGIYALARRPLEFLTGAVLSPLTGMAMPAVARLQHDKAKVDDFFDRSIRVAAFVGFPTFMGAAAIAPDAIPLVFGEQWSSGVLAVQIIMFLGVVRTIDSICAGAVLALGHSSLILKLNLAYTVIGLVLMTLAAQVSLVATMAAIVFCNLLLVPVFLFYTRRLAGIDVTQPLMLLPRVALATALMFGAVALWRSFAFTASEPMILISSIAVGAAVYGLAALVLLRPELNAARDLLARMRPQAA
jgi:O-antigen/teichoic acid export membrane protein